MLSHLPKLVLIMFVGFTFLAGLTFYSFVNYRQDTMVVTANETIRSAALASRDYSARVNPGQFKLQQEKFETEFVKLFNENRNVAKYDHDEIKFVFDYLDDGEGGILGIRVRITLEETEFQTTVIVS